MRSLLVGAATVLLLLAAVPASAAPQHGGTPQLTFATFERFGPTTKAVTYKDDLVPVGARVVVFSVERHGKTTIVLVLNGLVPNRTYGAHVHVKNCGPKPADSGPHYQNVVDPKQPSVDPAYANRRNEVWLDITTDESGTGSARSTVNWQFTDRHAESVVVHAEKTSTHPGHAGTAGDRLACVNHHF